jgi:hypothetical protein
VRGTPGDCACGQPAVRLAGFLGLPLAGPTAMARGWAGAASQHAVQSSPEVRSSRDPLAGLRNHAARGDEGSSWCLQRRPTGPTP